MSTERCGYTLVDSEGEQYPCDRPASLWRWYQNVEHEDSLDEACELHENEGGRRMHAAESELRRLRTQLGCVKALATLWEEEAADFTRVSAQSGGSTALDVRAEANQIHAAALREMLAD